MPTNQPNPTQLTEHPLYGTLPDSAPSCGEAPARRTVLGRLVHGFPIDIPIPENFTPTYQSWSGPGAKFKNVKGNIPLHPTTRRPVVSDKEWDHVFNSADTEIDKWYKVDSAQRLTREEANALRAEDRTMGITRACALYKLRNRGDLPVTYWDLEEEQ